jgi:hypothetical protein
VSSRLPDLARPRLIRHPIVNKAIRQLSGVKRSAAEGNVCGLIDPSGRIYFLAETQPTWNVSAALLAAGTG